MSRVAIIQARMSSTRLPGKALIELNEKPMLLNILERISRAKTIDKVVVATSDHSDDDAIETLTKETGYFCFRGDLDNVLKRFFECAREYQADVIVRLTGDNALVDPNVIDEAIDYFEKNDLNYLEYKTNLPLGMVVEVFDYASLEKTYKEAKDSECIEHVTPYLYKNPDLFKTCSYKNPKEEDNSDLRFTMDTEEDYRFVSTIYKHFGQNLFSYRDVLDVLQIHPEWIKFNSDVVQKQVQYQGEN